MKQDQALDFYFAPLEGITGYLFRQIHAEMFPGIDRYYIPFIAPHTDGSLKNKELADIAPENNAGAFSASAVASAAIAVPQVLTNRSHVFLMTARRLRGLGYEMVDLNLGCPSPTVVPKGKGAGFLADPEGLERFFEEVFSDELFASGSRKQDHVTGAVSAPGGRDERQGGSVLPGAAPMQLSVKTRLGMSDPAEAGRLFAIYDKYPLTEIIVHARTREQYYRGAADVESFKRIAEREARSGCVERALCFNGNLYTPADVRKFAEAFPPDKYPQIKAVMIGRGLIRNPALVRECRGGKPLELAELKEFHDRLYAVYKEKLSGPAHLLGHMKELWIYWETLLCEEASKPIKKVRKAKTAAEYESAARAVFASAALMDTNAPPRETLKIRL